MTADRITALLPEDALNSYGWRLGFLLAAVFGLIALDLPRNVAYIEAAEESPGLRRSKVVPSGARRSGPTGSAWFRSSCYTIPDTIGNYMFLNYIAAFAHTTTGIDISTALLANSCAVAV